MKLLKNIIIGFAITVSSLIGSSAQAADAWQDITQGEYSYKALTIKMDTSGPALIFSDSPEYVQDYGILYEDNLQGDVRIFYYHVNDKWTQARIAIVVQNDSFKPTNISINKAAMPKPSIHWQNGGQQAQQLYFAEQKPYKKTLKGMEQMELLSGDNGLVYARNELAQGIIELHADAPINIKIISLPVSAQAFEYVDIAKHIATDDVRRIPLRGTFPQADRTLVVEPVRLKDNELEGVVVADGVVDKFAVGKDAVTGKAAENYGNYGVFYEILFENKSKGKIAVRMNGTGGLIAGQLLVGEQKAKHLKKVDFPSQGARLFSEFGTETVFLGEFPRNFKGRIIFSPPGTGNLPVTLLFYKLGK